MRLEVSIRMADRAKPAWRAIILLLALIWSAGCGAPSVPAESGRDEGPVRTVTILYTGYGRGAVLPVVTDPDCA